MRTTVPDGSARTRSHGQLRSVAVLAAVTLAVGTLAHGQCPEVVFEEQAIGTRITNQYAGVTFFSLSSENQAAFPRVFLAQRTDPGPATYATSSPLRALSLAEGFDVVVPEGGMNFVRGQSLVQFSLGENTGTYTVRAYSDTAGTNLISTTVVPLGSFGAAQPGTNRLVRLTATAPNLTRRITVRGDGGFKRVSIDTLSYDQDSTPPEVEITEPLERTCICPTGSVLIRGYAYEPDGLYGGDRLDVMRVDAPVGTAWTNLASFAAPAPPPVGSVYTLNAADVLAALPGGGDYRVRVIGRNACGLTGYDETRVYIDTFAPTVALRSPAAGQIVGGNVCFDGTVTDRCSVNFQLAFRPLGGAVFTNIGDPVNSEVINDPLGAWNTRSGPTAVPDGTYEIRVAANDSCGRGSNLVRTVTVDNTPPTAILTSPVACSSLSPGLIEIRGTVTDANMSGWTIQYAGGPAGTGWTTIAAGTGNVVNGVLAVWDTSALPACAYALRLIVSDAAAVDCGAGSNRTELVRLINLGSGTTCLADIVSIGGLPPADGLLTGDDFNAFINSFAAGCP
ncbi:MAG: hypothetical protein IOD15_12735 [Phycisphaerales bacterium]|nr:hypothetical protein [Phycisphaerales bacterium]